jgi:hypothetical protein
MSPPFARLTRAIGSPVEKVDDIVHFHARVRLAPSKNWKMQHGQ